MSKFKRVVCYCLIYSIFLNNLLTSFANTAYASDVIQDIISETEELRHVSTQPGIILEDAQLPRISAKQAVIEDDITNTWKNKHTLKGVTFSCSTILHIIWFGLSIFLGLAVLNAFEALSAKTLFPAIGIGHVGVGTEKPFYEATAATHGIIFAGLVPTIYTFFKFGKGPLDNGITLISNLKSRYQKQKKADSEKGPIQKNDQEKLTQAKKQVFQKWHLPQFLGYIIPGLTSIGAASIYSLISVVNLYQTEMPRFPIFFKSMYPFLIIFTVPDKWMTGHGATKEILEWGNQKSNRKIAQRRYTLKQSIEKTYAFIKNLDLETPQDRNVLRKLIRNLLPEDETSSILNEEPEELNTISSSMTGMTGEITPSSELPGESGQGSSVRLDAQIDTSEQKNEENIKENPNFQQEDFVEPGASPIAYEKLYNLIREHDSSTQSHGYLSQISRYLSYGISFLGVWGLSTVMTQDLETIFKISEKLSMIMTPDQKIIFATVLGSLAGGWIAFAEKRDIYKTLKSFGTSFTSQLFIRKSNGDGSESHYNPRSPKNLLKFMANILLYKSFLALTAWAFTFPEFSSYLNVEGQRYENIFTRTNNHIPVIKYIGLIALYLFEIPSYIEVQERGYNGISRRLKQATIWSKSLSSYHERLIGVLEVMSKKIDHLTEEGLTVLEKQIFPDLHKSEQTPEELENFILSDETMPPSKWHRFTRWVKNCYSIQHSQYSEEDVSLAVNDGGSSENDSLLGDQSIDIDED